DYVLGGSALFAMAWGQGLLLLVVGAGSSALLPRAGVWMEYIKHFFGLLLLATAWWMISPVISAGVLMLGWAFLAMWAAVMLGAFKGQSADTSNGGVSQIRLVLRAMGLLLAVWAAILLIGLASGSRDSLQPLGAILTTNTVNSQSSAAQTQ